MNSWPFNEPRNEACIISNLILSGADTIVFVLRDKDDGMWQFLGTAIVTVDTACVVALHEVLALDDSIRILADLPIGWEASREDVNSPWVRAETP